MWLSRTEREPIKKRELDRQVGAAGNGIRRLCASSAAAHSNNTAGDQRCVRDVDAKCLHNGGGELKRDACPYIDDL